MQWPRATAEQSLSDWHGERPGWVISVVGGCRGQMPFAARWMKPPSQLTKPVLSSTSAVGLLQPIGPSGIGAPAALLPPRPLTNVAPPDPAVAVVEEPPLAFAIPLGDSSLPPQATNSQVHAAMSREKWPFRVRMTSMLYHRPRFAINDRARMTDAYCPDIHRWSSRRGSTWIQTFTLQPRFHLGWLDHSSERLANTKPNASLEVVWPGIAPLRVRPSQRPTRSA
jgi:hypothetical protein